MQAVHPKEGDSGLKHATGGLLAADGGVKV